MHSMPWEMHTNRYRHTQIFSLSSKKWMYVKIKDRYGLSSPCQHSHSFFSVWRRKKKIFDGKKNQMKLKCINSNVNGFVHCSIDKWNYNLCSFSPKSGYRENIKRYFVVFYMCMFLKVKRKLYVLNSVHWTKKNLLLRR